MRVELRRMRIQEAKHGNEPDSSELELRQRHNDSSLAFSPNVLHNNHSARVLDHRSFGLSTQPPDDALRSSGPQRAAHDEEASSAALWPSEFESARNSGTSKRKILNLNASNETMSQLLPDWKIAERAASRKEMASAEERSQALRRKLIAAIDGAQDILTSLPFTP
jgi:hypothetical protein